MAKRRTKVLLHLASPSVGKDIRGLLREFSGLAGVLRVVPVASFSRLLRVDYDPGAIAFRTLLARARRGWSAARLVGI